MISAKKAREISEQTVSSIQSQELRRVEELIHRAINKGEQKIYIEGNLHASTKNSLELLGYVVEFDCRYNEFETIIKW